METDELLELIGTTLKDDIADLEEDLEPILTSLSATTKKLPVLDRAKLYVLVAFTIESLLFSYLRLNGVQAREHPVFKELTRVKQYFEKVKQAEIGPVKPRENLSLNKEAAQRIVKHALEGNDNYDAERRERELREKLLAARKPKSLEDSMKEKANSKVEEIEKPDSVSDEEAEEGEISSDHESPLDQDTKMDLDDDVQEEQTANSSKKRKKSKPSDESDGRSLSKKEKKKAKNRGRKERKRQKIEAQQIDITPG